MTSDSLRAPSPRVAVVTVSFRSSPVLEGFLDSIARSSERSLLTIVVDNVPEGDPIAAELAESHGAEYLAPGQNLGYGGAINAAVATLPESVDWILVSNPDVALKPRSIDQLVDAGDLDPAIGSVGPSILTAEGDIYPSARSIPSLRTGVGHALFANLWLTNPWTRSYRNDLIDHTEPRDAGWLSGACVLVRRTAFTELGGFDDGFFMYFEDVDLGFRLGKAGYRNRYYPSAVVVHTGAHSTDTDSARMVRVHHESARRFLGKKYHGVLLWPVRIALRAGLSVRSALVARRLEARRVDAPASHHRGGSH